MSSDLGHSLELARALACTGDLARASAQIDRLRTLDLHGRFTREIDSLAAVVAVRSRRLDLAEQLVRGLGPLTPEGIRFVGDLLSSTPEAGLPEYQRAVRQLLKRAERGTRPDHAGIWHASVAWLRDGGWTTAVSAVSGTLLVLSLAWIAWLLWRPTIDTPEQALDRMLSRLHAGEFREIWDDFPERLRSDGDLALRAALGRIPPTCFADFRAIDANLSAIIRERRRFLAASSAGSVGPAFGTLSDEEESWALADYLARLANGRLYDREWAVKQATVSDAIAELTTGEFRTCWRAYFRSWVLDLPGWRVLLGLAPDEPGSLSEFLAAQRYYAIATPDDGTGFVEVAVVTPRDNRHLIMPMRLVDGKWMPAGIAQKWQLIAVQSQLDPAVAGQVLRFLMGIRPDFDPGRLDERKRLLYEAARVAKQEDFDARADKYFEP